MQKVIWLSELIVRIGKSIWKKPEVKETEELQENLREARSDKILIPEEIQLDIF